MVSVRIGNCRAHMAGVVALAKKVYDPKDVSSLQKYLDLYDKCPEAFVCAFDDKTQELIGYIISLPLDKKYFESTCSADYTEADLTVDKVKKYEKGNNYVYLFSIVSDPKYHSRMDLLRAMSRAYVAQLREMAKKGFYVLEASAIALSDSGQKICLGMNMNTLGENEKGVVFHTNKFHKLYIDHDTKQDVIRNFIINRNKQRAILTEQAPK